MRSISLASDGSCLVAGNNKVLLLFLGEFTAADVRFQGKCFVWKINEERSELPRFQAVTKFQAHSKYLTRCLLSPDVK